jgi:hypothetical protein
LRIVKAVLTAEPLDRFELPDDCCHCDLLDG